MRNMEYENDISHKPPNPQTIQLAQMQTIKSIATKLFDSFGAFYSFDLPEFEYESGRLQSVRVHEQVIEPEVEAQPMEEKQVEAQPMWEKPLSNEERV